MIDALPGNGKPPEGTEAEAAWLRGKRDRALVLTGFAGAFRRSELASLRQERIDSRPDGLLITVPESKTDQEGKGQLVAIRRIEGSSYCPVKALRKWTAAAQIEEGAIFRGVPRSGTPRSGPPRLPVCLKLKATQGTPSGRATSRRRRWKGLPTRRFRRRVGTSPTGRFGSTSAHRSSSKTPPARTWGCRLGRSRTYTGASRRVSSPLANDTGGADWEGWPAQDRLPRRGVYQDVVSTMTW